MKLHNFSWFLKKTLKYYTIFKPKNTNEFYDAIKCYCKNEKKYANKFNNLCIYSQFRRLKNIRFTCTHFVCTCFAHINNWDVSNVTNMNDMFSNAENFNQPLNNWDVSNVTDMSYMFYNAKKFNQSLNNWYVSNVITMDYIFSWQKISSNH